MASISGTSGSSTSSSASNVTVGNNVAPISFPGIASGIDYNSIITKLTSLTLIPAQQAQTQVTQLNSANSELIKINGLLGSVQNALTLLSNPTTFDSFSGTSSNSAIATATDNGTGTSIPGSYTITSSQVATATSITGASSTSTGHKISDTISGDTINPANNGKPGDTVPLDESYFSITPSNGGNQRGLVTVDGIQVSYDVGSDSLQTILTNINTAVQSVDPGFSASYNSATDTVSFTSTDAPVSLGSQSDRGNLLTVLKLDVAQVNNTPTSGSVTSAGPVGGLSQSNTLTSAGFTTPLTGGDGTFFTINGVKITINPTSDNIASVLARINASGAGVVAAFNTTTNQVTLTSKNLGAQSIVLGSTATGDSSNFLAAVGLEGSGATTRIGQQASVTLQGSNGISQSYYSNSNTFASAIPGQTLTINQSTTSANPVTITVAQNAQPAIAAINSFVTAYNAVINEINNATAPPVVQQSAAGTGTSSTIASATQLTSGGPLYDNFEVEEIKDQLINLAQNIVNNGSSSYNSLSAIGLQLDSTHQVLQASSDTSSTSTTVSSGALSVSQADGTSGQLLPLDISTFEAAFAANPSAVASIFQDSQQGLVQTLGSYLTTVTGLPTQTTTGLIGNIPSTSLIQSDENSNSAQIQSLQDYIKQINDEANAQADFLRAEFTSSEALIAQYQAVQGQIGQLSQSTS